MTGFHQWYGQLTCTTNTGMFKLKLQHSSAQTIQTMGKPVKLPMQLKLNKGWNWLPYPYQEASRIKDAGGLFDHTVLTNGDVFKRNNAQFTRWYDVTGFKGWIGSPSAQDLEPGEGHKLLLASGGDFSFPAPTARRKLAEPSASVVSATKQTRLLSSRRQACGGGGSAGSDAATWTVPAGSYPDSNSMTVGVKLDGAIAEGGTLAGFFGSEVRGVQTDTTDVPGLPLAGEWASKKVFSLAVQGSVEDGDSGKTITFEYSPDGTSSSKLDTTARWNSDGIEGGAFNPFVVEGGSAPCPGGGGEGDGGDSVLAQLPTSDRAARASSLEGDMPNSMTAQSFGA